MGITAGFFYLYRLPNDAGFIQPDWYQQPLLLFFTTMLFFALVLNLLAVLGVEFRRTLQISNRREEAELNDFSWLAQQFLHQQSALPIQGSDRYFLHAEHGVLYYLQPLSEVSLDIGQLRQIFQQMLRHQCQSAVALARQPMASPAQIFALETNIRVLDKQQLSNWLNK